MPARIQRDLHATHSAVGDARAGHNVLETDGAGVRRVARANRGAHARVREREAALPRRRHDERARGLAPAVAPEAPRHDGQQHGHPRGDHHDGRYAHALLPRRVFARHGIAGGRGAGYARGCVEVVP